MTPLGPGCMPSGTTYMIQRVNKIHNMIAKVNRMIHRVTWYQYGLGTKAGRSVEFVGAAVGPVVGATVGGGGVVGAPVDGH